MMVISHVDERDTVTRLKYRRSIRLQGYDYSQKGYYFVTVCTNDRRNLFGIIEDGKVALNDVGSMVGKWWKKLERKYQNSRLDQYCIMPNHIHGIIQITTHNAEPQPVGADLCVRPHNVKNPSVGADLCVRPKIGQTGHAIGQTPPAIGQTPPAIGRTHRSAPTVGDMMRWFKTMTTNEYIANVKNNHWKPFNKRFWQRNYYEHVIRDDTHLNRVREYIVNNPIKWETDKYYVQKTET